MSFARFSLLTAVRQAIGFGALACALVVVPAVAQPTAAPKTTLANPASQNCADKGGTLTIEKNGKGGQFGVCGFPDNLQCEEWALLRGQCRAGGIRVTGYVTPAARYCAITGGSYKVTGRSNTPDEQGSCTFANGKTCNAARYFDGACSAGTIKPMASTGATPMAAKVNTIQATFSCAAGKSIRATFINGGAQNNVKLVLSDGRAVTLPQGMSGSGARYATANDSMVFWNKGNTAFIEEAGKTTYEGCATKT